MGFADGKERFNVWVAFMNLECTFGTEASAEAVFRRAASHNEAKQVGRGLPLQATKVRGAVSGLLSVKWF